MQSVITSSTQGKEEEQKTLDPSPFKTFYPSSFPLIEKKKTKQTLRLHLFVKLSVESVLSYLSFFFFEWCCHLPSLHPLLSYISNKNQQGLKKIDCPDPFFGCCCNRRCDHSTVRTRQKYEEKLFFFYYCVLRFKQLGQLLRRNRNAFVWVLD